MALTNKTEGEEEELELILPPTTEDSCLIIFFFILTPYEQIYGSGLLQPFGPVRISVY